MSERATVVKAILVEGESDAAAVRALATLTAFDLGDHHVGILVANGVTNYGRVLSEFLLAYPNAGVCGLYDVAEERFVRRALARTGIGAPDATSLESSGFFACVADLEDELIRALGEESVERVIEAQGELASLRRFQAMPQHRASPTDQQLRRFLGTRATRKIRSAQHLVEALTADHLPRPLALLIGRLQEPRSAHV